MEIGDLIYIIILVLFMILGFFNDSRKKKLQQQQEEMNNDSEVPPSHQPPHPIQNLDEKTVDFERLRVEFDREKWEKQKNEKEGEVSFQSSLGLLTNFASESSIQDSLTKYGTDLLYRQDLESSNIYEDDSESQELSDVKERKSLNTHPLVEALTGSNRKNEFVKGIIYSELFNRKY